MIEEKNGDIVENTSSKNNINDIVVENESSESEITKPMTEGSFTITIESDISATEIKETESSNGLLGQTEQIGKHSFTIDTESSNSKNESVSNDEAQVVQEKPPVINETVAPLQKNDVLSSGSTEASVPEKIKPLSNETVTTHTASLWKYLPIPVDEPEPHEEYKCMQAAFVGGQVVGASVRGKKHKHEGTNRDDWFEATDFQDWIIVAVSDGAGSKKFSRIGAKISCEAATTYIKEELTKQKDSYSKFAVSLAKPFEDPEFGQACGYLADLMQKSVLNAIAKVEEGFEARKSNPDYEKCVGKELRINDFAGTFLISIIVPVNVGEKKETLILSCQIGDGIIAAIDGDAAFASASKLLGEPDSGSFSGETDFLVSPAMKDANNLMSRTRITRGTSKTVLLMSDGVADDYFPNETEIKRLYLDLMANGIIGPSDIDMTVNKKTIATIKQLPNATAYPWVNDPSVIVSIHYVKKMLETMKCSLEELWGKKSILSYAALEVQGFENADNQAEKLKIWLDNYVERGSFDDRTLVIVNL